MKKADLNKLMDGTKIDSMILLPKSIDDSNFIVSQYEAKEINLINSLIHELVSPGI